MVHTSCALPRWQVGENHRLREDDCERRPRLASIGGFMRNRQPMADDYRWASSRAHRDWYGTLLCSGRDLREVGLGRCCGHELRWLTNDSREFARSAIALCSYVRHTVAALGSLARRRALRALRDSRDYSAVARAMLHSPLRKRDSAHRASSASAAGTRLALTCGD